MYRDRPLQCPRCRVHLLDKGPERWRCPQCRGIAMTSTELHRGIREIAPDLHDGKNVVATDRAAVKASPCPSCGDPMLAISVGPLDIDRCAPDELFWFDDWEHISLLAAARDAERNPWVIGLLDALG